MNRKAPKPKLRGLGREALNPLIVLVDGDIVDVIEAVAEAADYLLEYVFAVDGEDFAPERV